MKAMKAMKALGPIDARSVRRDSLLRWLVFYPIFLALLMRWGVPLLTVRLAEQYQFDLTPYYMLLMSFLVVMMPNLVGIIIGFLLLDQRDDLTLTALQVTPLTLNGYLLYRITMPMVLSTLMTMAIFPIAGLVKTEFFPLFIISLGAAPLAPIFALFLAAFAANKVQGFALMKASGVVSIPPLIAYFVKSDWQLAFGIIPGYWPIKSFWVIQSGDTNYWIYLLAGLAYQVLLVVVLLRRFNRVMSR